MCVVVAAALSALALALALAALVALAPALALALAPFARSVNLYRKNMGVAGIVDILQKKKFIVSNVELKTVERYTYIIRITGRFYR